MQADRIPVVFYATRSSAEPVRDWLRELPGADRKQIGLDLLRVQEQWPIGMPVCRGLGQGLWEVRSNLSGNRISRVLFAFHQGQVIVLHGFIKKSRKTPEADLALARRRMKEVNA